MGKAFICWVKENLPSAQILRLSECHEDFTASMIQSLDEFRSIAAIMFLKSVQGLEYTNEETKRIKAWFKLCEQTDDVARKYGFEPLSLLSTPKELNEKEKTVEAR